MQYRLGVLGSPVDHRLTAALHAAAYRQLGLDWYFDAIETTAGGMAAFLASRNPSWRGLCLAPELAGRVPPLLDAADPHSLATARADTVLFDDVRAGRTVRGYNTEVHGITQALVSSGIGALEDIHLLGAGESASSTLLAARGLGARHALISVHAPLAALGLAQLGRGLGLDVTVRTLGESPALVRPPDVVVNTLPAATPVDSAFVEGIAGFGTDGPDGGTVLVDLAHHDRPSALASAWQLAGGRLVPGTERTLHQAVAQVRIFYSGDPAAALPDEPAVIAAMTAALGQ